MAGRDGGAPRRAHGPGLGIDGLAEASQIGEGGNAVVYRAFQPALDRYVAVKVLKGLVDADARRRFDRERKAMGRLSEHEGIVTVYESGFTDRGEPYLVMPLLPGSLDDELRRGPLGWADAVEVMASVCDTVGIAHDNGVVHRDLKPGNIMRSPTGRPLVADFGIARVVDASSSYKSTAITLTPAYSPPEALEATLASARADVYSLGATLFALIAGHAPHVDPAREASLLVLMRRILDDPVPDLRPAIPDALQAVIERAMAKDPADRYDDAAELAAALRSVVNGSTATGPPGHADHAGGTAPSPRSARVGRSGSDGDADTDRRRRLWLTGALAATVVAVAVFALTLGRADDATNTTFGSSGATASPDVAGATDDAPAGGDEVARGDAAPTPTTEPTGRAEPDDPEPSATEPAQGEQEQPPASPVAADRTGPSSFEPYAITVASNGAEAWTIVPRGQETIVRVDPVTLEPTGAADLGFFAPIIAVGDGWIAGAGVEGQLGVVDLDTGEVARIDLDRNARQLAADGGVLWVATASDEGSETTLHRFDRRTLSEEATTDIDDFVLYLDAADGRVWTAAGAAIRGFDAESLELVVETTTGISPIDDIDAHGDALWVSGGVFDPDLAGDELTLAAVVRIDAGTGAATPVRILSDGLSIFERAAVAAGDGGAWVSVETTTEAFFFADDGTVDGPLSLPPAVREIALVGDALWVVSGSSTSGQIWVIDPAVT